MAQHFTLCLLLLCFTIAAVGQELTEKWKVKIPSDGKNDVVHAVYQSMNGDLVIVGESWTDKSEKDGLLLIIDEASGQLIERHLYGKSNGRDDAIYDIVQLPDGGFYLVGASASKYDTEGLLIKTDEFGRRLEESILGTGMLQKVILLDNSNLLIGGKKSQDDGNIWLVQYKDRRIQQQHFIGDGKYASLEGMIATFDNHILLCGNTKKSKSNKVNEGNIWLAEIDTTHKVLQEEIVKNKGWSQIRQVSTTYDKQLLLAGEKLKNGKDAWVLEVDDKLKLKVNEAIGGREDEVGFGIIKTYEDQYILTSMTINNMQNEVMLLQGFKKMSSLALPLFDIKDVWYSYQRSCIIAGVTLENGRYSIQLVNLIPPSPRPIASKSLDQPRLELVGVLQLYDQNGDGKLAPNERAALKFKLRNSGTGALVSATAHVVTDTPLKSVSYFEKRYLSYVAAGGEKSVELPFNPDALFVGGKFSGAIEIRSEENKILLRVPFTIGGDISASGSLGNIIVDWDNTATSRRTTESSVEIKARVYTDRPLRSQDVKVYVNGVLLDDSKSPPTLEQTQVSGTYASLFARQIPLLQGENKIFLLVENNLERKQTEPIIVIYEPKLPNLHVLTIGPPYQDLKYTGKDAKDFANAMRKQKGKGLFNQVFIRELTDYESTTCQNIRVEFESLYNRFRKNDGLDQITPNDLLVIFISSHGKKVNGEFRIIPSDYNEDRELTTTVDYRRDVLQFLNLIPCKKMVFTDACHSGAAKSKSRITSASISRALNELNSAASGMLTMSSCGDEELSYEDESWQNGAFTKALLEALSGQSVTLSNGETIVCDSSEGERGILSIKEIYAFLQKRVPDLVQQKYGKGALQTPFMPENSLNNELHLFVVE
jgi:hypothetical protein